MSLPNHLQFSTRRDEPDDDWTAQCASDTCDSYRRPSQMQQCRSCEKFRCPCCWENDYDSELCVSCWSHRMDEMARRLRQDEVEEIRNELLMAREAA